jgi:hypothetical protein
MALRGITRLVRALLYRLRIGRGAQMRTTHKRNCREFELLNLYAHALNEQGDESAAYQAAWHSE